MNTDLRKRLAALEEGRRSATSGIVLFGFVTDGRGDVEAFTLPALGRTLPPDEFWALVDRWADVVFVPGEPVPDPTFEAYHEIQEGAVLSLTYDDLVRENERVAEAAANGGDPGPSVIETALERARAADPERAALADEYAEGWDATEEVYWAPMRERSGRLFGVGGTLVGRR